MIETTEAEIIDSAAIQLPAADVSPTFLRFHMWDGSVIGGDVSNSTISIETRFGMLEVPVSEIVEIFPGLVSSPRRAALIEQHVQMLGDREFRIERTGS